MFEDECEAVADAIEELLNSGYFEGEELHDMIYEDVRGVPFSAFTSMEVRCKRVENNARRLVHFLRVCGGEFWLVNEKLESTKEPATKQNGKALKTDG